MRVESSSAREYYITHTEQENWSTHAQGIHHQRLCDGRRAPQEGRHGVRPGLLRGIARTDSGNSFQRAAFLPKGHGHLCALGRLRSEGSDYAGIFRHGSKQATLGITGKTAAEQIYGSADATTIHMGLTSWKNAPQGKVQKSDTAVAKNCLSAAHIDELNRIVSAYLELVDNRPNVAS